MADSSKGQGKKFLITAGACLGLGMFPSSVAGAETKPAAPAPLLSFAEHVAQLKKTVPRGFSVVEQPPFVVIGDEWPATLQRRASNTVQWAVDLLKKDFFQLAPSEPIDIWLFKDNESYRKYARQIFNETPSTPNGYSRPQERRLVVNVSNGNGVLVHEIMHPLMRANFPACPPWFNEGLASLFESSREVDGHIRGETNQRLPGLQEAIRLGRVPSLSALLGASDAEFHGKNESLYYAQARYLCFHLQERGALANFYREFASNVSLDPTGATALKKVLAEDNLAAFQKKWEASVLALKYP